MQEQSNLVSCCSFALERVVQLRIKEKADLLLGITEAVEQENIGTGVIVSGIGALEKAVFRNLKRFPEQYPVQKSDRIYLDIEQPMELVSLGGWIARTTQGDVEVHAHFSASTVQDGTVTTLGGHLTEGTRAGIKVVVALAVLEEGKAAAEYDERTRSLDLCLKKSQLCATNCRR